MLFALMLAVLFQADTTLVRVHGKAVDASGGATPYFTILYRRDPADQRAWRQNDGKEQQGFRQTKPLADGTYTLELKPGFYDICAFSPGDEPMCVIHEITVTNPKLPNFKLKLSKAMTDGFADKVY